MKIYCISIYNENFDFFKKNNLIPVGIGKNKFSKDWLNDKNKDNISDKNDNFGEYTFHYSIWKNNTLNDYSNWIGFCTYRRFWTKKNYFLPKNITDLENILLKDVPIEWNEYDVVLPKKLRFGKIKVMKLLKNNFLQVLKKPSLLFNDCTMRDHFNLFHGNFFLEEAIKLLDENTKNEFVEYLNSQDFNPHNLFICKNSVILNEYYKFIFNWMFKCEEKFKNLKLDTYGKKRIYGFLAERLMPFWFKKHFKIIEWPYVFFDTNK